MLKKGDWMYIRAEIERGVYKKDIAEELGVHPRTVRRALARGGAPSGTRPGARGSKLDLYTGEVDKLLMKNVWNAVVIFRLLQEKGYRGRITILRDYIRPKRALRKSRETVRFETAPGWQLQSDWGELWGEVAGRRTKIHFIVNTLGFSRRFHFWCTTREDAEHTYEGLARSFEYFGGMTKEVLVDNQKATVIAHRIGDRVKFNERFLDMASHCGFIPRACRPNRARTKGKDERMVGYIKGNFFQRYRTFESFAHMNQRVQTWLREEADCRVHGTVKEVVAERFKREAPALSPLPAVRYDTSYRERRVVTWDGYVEIRGNRYSVPDRLCSAMVTVRISLDGVLRIYDEEEKVAEYRLRPASEGWVTTPGHHDRLWRETLSVERRDLSVYEEVASCSSRASLGS
jgi:transposase